MELKENKYLKKYLIVGLMTIMCFLILSAFSISEVHAASKIHLKKTTITMTVGTTYQQRLLTLSNKVISTAKVKWSSNNNKVVKISKYGKITAIKSGTTTIKAKYNGKTYSCRVKVEKGITGKQYYSMRGSGQTKTIDVKWKDGFSGSITSYVLRGGNVVGIVDVELISEAEPGWSIYRLTVKGYKSGTAVIRILPEGINQTAIDKNKLDITVEIGTLTDSLIDLSIHNLKSKMYYPDTLNIFSTEIEWIVTDRYLKITIDYGGKADTGNYLRGTYEMMWTSQDGLGWSGSQI